MGTDRGGRGSAGAPRSAGRAPRPEPGTGTGVDDLDRAERELLADPGAGRDPQLGVWRAIQRARDALRRGDAPAGRAILEEFVAGDREGLHTYRPEFHAALRDCRLALGLDARNAGNQAEELRSDWLDALHEGEELLRAGRAAESVAAFNRSLNANPGEAGTAPAAEAARRGLAAAEALLRRRPSRGRC